MSPMHLLDTRTQEPLEIEFGLESDTMTINGIEVKRLRPLETNDDELVYGRPGAQPQKIYHLSGMQVKQIRERRDRRKAE